MIEIDPELDLQLTNELIIDTAVEIYDNLLGFVDQQNDKENAYRSRLVLSLVNNNTPYPETVLGTLHGLTYGGSRRNIVVLGSGQADSELAVYWSGCIEGNIFYVKEEYEFGPNDTSKLTSAYALNTKPNQAADIRPNLKMFDTPTTRDSALTRVISWLLNKPVSM